MCVCAESPAIQEFRVYDSARRSPDWTSLVGPAQCAVFLKDVKTLAPLTGDGQPARWEDSTFFRFDTLAEARTFCEAQAERSPGMCCEIFDSAGRSKPPLFTIVHAKSDHDDELSGLWVRRRKLLAAVCVGCAIPLIVWDARKGFLLILPTLIGINLIVLALRLFSWNSAKPALDRVHQERIAEHLKSEKARDDAEPQPKKTAG